MSLARVARCCAVAVLQEHALCPLFPRCTAASLCQAPAPASVAETGTE